MSDKDSATKEYMSDSAIFADAFSAVNVSQLSINSGIKSVETTITKDSMIDEEALPAGAVKVCSLIVNGRLMNFYSYSRKYYDDIAKQNKLFLPSGTVVVTAAGAGERLYGAVSQINEGDTDPTTYSGARVPHVTVDRHQGIRTLTEKSRPLLKPKQLNPWVSASVL